MRRRYWLISNRWDAKYRPHLRSELSCGEPRRPRFQRRRVPFARFALRDRITRLIRDGKSIDETVAAKPTADFDAKWGNGPIRPDQIVEEVYSDMKRKLR